MSKVIIISNSNNRLKRYLLSLEDSYYYIYLGERRNRVLKDLDRRGFKEIKREIPDELMKKDFCRSYIDLIGKLGLRYHSVYWWVTFVSSKNRFASGLMNRLFFLYSVVERIKRYKNQNILIINLDKSIALSLKKYLKEHNMEFVSFENRINQIVDSFVMYIKSLISAILFVYRLWKKIYITRRYLGKTLKTRIKNRTYYVIKTTIYNASFDANNKYRDSFFGRLPEYLKEKKEILILAEIFDNYKQVIEKIKKKQNFLIVPLYYFLSYIDPIKTVLELFMNRVIIKEKTEFLDFDVSEIINSEIRADFKRGSPFGQYFYYTCIKKLLKCIKIETFTLTYENNPWEKMCILALRRYSPDTKIIGYQHNVIPQASANMFISRYEKDIIPLPDKITTVGVIPKIIMEKYGSINGNRIRPSCGLRFEYLFKIKEMPRSYSRQILIALEGIPEACRMVNYVFKQLKDSLEYRVIIRAHPLCPFNKIKNRLMFDVNLFPNFSVSRNSSLEEDIKECGVVIYWGSTVGLEASVIGRPTIHFDRGDVLSYDPLFENPFLKWVVCEKDNLKEKLNYIYNIDDMEFERLRCQARKYLSEYIYSINEERLKEFLSF